MLCVTALGVISNFSEISGSGSGNDVFEPGDNDSTLEDTSPDEDYDCNGNHVDSDNNNACDNCGEPFFNGGENPDEVDCQHEDKDDNELCDKCERPFADGTDVIVPEEPIETVSFGGTIIKHWDFDNLDSSGKDTDGNSGVENIKIALKSFSHSFEGDKLKVTSSANGSTSDAFLILGENTRTYLSNSNFYVIDFDFIIPSDYPFEIVFCPDGRKEGGGISIHPSSKITLRNGKLYNYNDESVEVGESFHLTYIANYLGYSYVFVNGSFAFYTLMAATPYVDGLRISPKCDSNLDETYSFTIDNVVLSYFDEEYNGPFLYYKGTHVLSDFVDKNLADCEDSIPYYIANGTYEALINQYKEEN